MMDPATVLTRVYVLVDESCQQHQDEPAPGAPGPAPALSRGEGMALVLFAQWNRFPSERAFYRYAECHRRPACPCLPARSQFGRLVGVILPVALELAQRMERGLIQISRRWLYFAIRPAPLNSAFTSHRMLQCQRTDKWIDIP